jgi:hypothetical protein
MDAPILVASAYLAALAGGFAAFAGWETIAPARAAHAPLARRWPANLGLMAINYGVLPLFLPLSNAGAAWLASANGWGLLHAIDVPLPVAFVATFVAMDFARYLYPPAAASRAGPVAVAPRAPQRRRLRLLARGAFSSVRGDRVDARARDRRRRARRADRGGHRLGRRHARARVLLARQRAHRARGRSRAATRDRHARDARNASQRRARRVGEQLRRGAFRVGSAASHVARPRARAGDAIVFGLADERDAARLGLPRLLAMPFAR